MPTRGSGATGCASHRCQPGPWPAACAREPENLGVRWDDSPSINADYIEFPAAIEESSELPEDLGKGPASPALELAFPDLCHAPALVQQRAG